MEWEIYPGVPNTYQVHMPAQPSGELQLARWVREYRDHCRVMRYIKGAGDTEVARFDTLDAAKAAVVLLVG